MTVGVRRDGVRHAAPPAEIERLLHRHPPRPAASSAEQLADLDRRYDAIGGLSPSPLAHRGPTRQELPPRSTRGRPGGSSSSSGMRHAAPTIEEAVSTARRRRASSGSSAWCSPRTTRRCRSASTSSGRPRRPRRMASASSASRAGRPSRRLRRLPRRARARRRGDDAAEHQGACSPPTRSRRDPRHRRPLPATRCAATAIGGRGRRRARVAGASGRSRGSRPGAPPSRGSGRTSSRSSTTSAAAEHADGLLVCPCGFVADHLEVLYDLDVEAASVPRRPALAFARTAVVNDDPARDRRARWPPSSPTT